MTQPGDLIFYRAAPRSFFISKVIAAFAMFSGRGREDSAFSHVAIVADDPKNQYEATWPKTCESPIHFDKPVEIWRFKGIEDWQINSVTWWCQNNLGQWYDLGQFLLGIADFKHAEICSTFAWKAYHCAGIDLGTRMKKFKFPHELIDDRLEKIYQNY